MKTLFLTLAAISFFLLSCTSSKELQSIKSEKSKLESQLSEVQSRYNSAETSMADLQKKFAAVTQQKNDITLENEECQEDLAAIKGAYNSYQEKLYKLRVEVQAAFPNNLNEANFSVIEEDGRLVIILPNKILYKRGQAEFDGLALETIQKLAKAFRNNPGLQILVEGHTDEIPLKAGSKYKDNWDLSMARAVNVTRQLETYGVHPARLTAAGRGYFSPRNKLATEEARAMNRRTEIIVRPKISEFLKIVDTL